MPYYRGDYYRGDYYRGDPGFFSFLGGIAKGVGGLIGGPIGGVLKGVGGLMAPSAAADTAVPVARAAAMQAPMATSPVAANTYGIGVGTGYGITGAGAFMTTDKLLPAGGGRGRRVHANKSTYVTRGGGTSRWPKSLKVHPKGTEAVTGRRMNVGNGRALHRAARRIHGAIRMYRHIFSVAHPKAIKGHVFVKRKGKR